MAAVVESPILSGLLRSPNKRGMSVARRLARVVIRLCAGIAYARCRGLRARTRSIQRKRWFFYRAVVIRMQCSRSPRALHDIATHSRLGGQHGEEAKDEDEVSGEKGRAQDEGAPEEEVK